MSKHNHFLVDNEELTDMYDIGTRWITIGEFSITRRRVENIDNLPFEYMVYDWVFEVKTPNIFGKVETHYLSEIEECTMENLITDAMMYGIDWRGMNVHWLEEWMPREYKWDKSILPGYVPHVDILLSKFDKDDKHKDDPLYRIMHLFMKYHHNQLPITATGGDTPF